MFTQDDPLPELRRSGDAYLIAAAALHGAVLVGVGAAHGSPATAGALAAFLLGLAAVAFRVMRGTWANSVLLTLVLVAFVAAEIHFGLGRSELHFGVFVTLSFLLVYRHWLPIVVGAAAFAVHHVLFDRLQAWGFPLYCLTAPSFSDILTHAGYVVAQAGVGVAMALRMRRDALLTAELEALTRGLAGPDGKTVDFDALALPLRTPAALQLKDVLDRVQAVVLSVRGSVESVSLASREIAMGNLDLSRRTEDTAANLQATSSALLTYTDSVNESARTTKEMAVLAEQSLQAAHRGGSAAEELGARMQAITESARKITDITSAIDAIAFQTNILALNAAVESARAGEAGRGFAVVAGEVRLLAQRSALAAREVKDLIQNSVRQIEAGVAIADDTRSALADIDGEVRQVARLASALSGSLSDQSRGITAITGTIGQLDRNTQQNAALVEQSAATAESLKSQAVLLEKAMSAIHNSRTLLPAVPVATGPIPVPKAGTQAAAAAAARKAFAQPTDKPTAKQAAKATAKATAKADTELRRPAATPAFATAQAGDGWDTF